MEKEERRKIYKITDAFKTGFMQVSEIHNVYWEISGNPLGEPVLILHGGPGGGCQDFYRGFFDPEFYKIVQFDQRGSGKSEPSACLVENTTWDLVRDAEQIRTTLGIDKWHTVFGGSWGSTLSLAYAETHPEVVGHLVLRGIFLVRKSEIQYFYQEGTSWLFPDYHEELINLLPEREQGDILTNFHKRLNGTDEAEKLIFAKAWTKWEMATCKLYLDKETIAKGEDEKFAVAFARIETHYFINNGFLTDNQLLNNAYKIKDIPTIIVQGRYDVVCPTKSAWELHKKLNNSTLHIVPDSGHSCSEHGIIDELVKATDKFKTD